MKKVLVSTEVLNRVWNEWLSQQQLTNHERIYTLGRPFGSTSPTNKVKRFDDWIFEQGGSIRRVNKKFYIEFTDPNKASWFVLKNT